ncbi:MAG: type II toxin-antitoxin system VapC family toxin [Deltaproteobacteria bacterium]|nr:MAG: type II toxin-antitoxin system VapC family toxin [Deltaproteobacteria bacterium]
MILYLDTSALLKKYFKEPGSAEVIGRWKEAKAIVTSSVAYAETLASFHRKKREVTINAKTFGNILKSFRRDWSSFIRVEVSDDLNETIDKIVDDYRLRGFDAIHLASALIIDETVSENFLFACYDKRLILAAQKTGLQTLPERLA